MLWIVLIALAVGLIVMSMWKRPVKIDHEIAASVAEAKKRMVAESQARQQAQQDPGASPRV
jgi:hypothetical protein